MGKIFVISAPSGTGKTTIVKRLLKAMPDMALSVSYTTRKLRPEERDGVDYYFVDKDVFMSMVKAGKFVEWTEVHGHLYGTTKALVDKCVAGGQDVLLDIDADGAAKVRKKYPHAVSIFLLPPSFEDLEKRLRLRGADALSEIEKRVDNARGEFVRRHEYDYQVVNEDIDEAFGEVLEVINYYRGRQG